MNQTPLELAREAHCAYRSNGSCAHVNHALGWTHSLSLSLCDQCAHTFPFDPDGPAAVAARERIVELVINGVRKLPPHTLKPAVLEALPKHLPPDEAEKFRSDPAVLEAIALHEGWVRAKPSWSAAASLMKSLTSRGLSNYRVPLTVLSTRRSSCGLEGSTPCVALRKSQDGTHHFCGACGCGDTELARLDGDGYTKLHYPYLECPLNRPGFSNGRVDPLAVFDAVVCVSLDRRPERWATFNAQTAAFGWPIHRFSAMDGLRLPAPRGWPSGAGAWGCFLSHRRILEDAVAAGVNSVLIFEDDCTFHPDFVDLLSRFLAEVPQNWDGLMLGGQHLQDPIAISPGVVRCLETNRTHAYAVRGDYLRQLLEDWESWTPVDGIGHVDHLMQRRHAEFKVFAPAEFICGQAPGRSDILGAEVGHRTWNPPKMRH